MDDTHVVAIIAAILMAGEGIERRIYETVTHRGDFDQMGNYQAVSAALELLAAVNARK